MRFACRNPAAPPPARRISPSSGFVTGQTRGQPPPAARPRCVSRKFSCIFFRFAEARGARGAAGAVSQPARRPGGAMPAAAMRRCRREWLPVPRLDARLPDMRRLARVQGAWRSSAEGGYRMSRGEQRRLQKVTGIGMALWRAEIGMRGSWCVARRSSLCGLAAAISPAFRCHWPTRPSIRSRSRSAWPQWRAYSSII